MSHVGEEEASEGVVGLLFVHMMMMIIVWINVFIADHETRYPLVTPK